MRGWLVGVASLLLGCSTSGNAASPAGDAGGDATIADGGADAEDANEEAEAAPPCVSIVQGTPTPSTDCVYAGSCPAGCAGGTAAAYACNASTVGGGAGAYPSSFQAPTGIVSIVAYDMTTYPWDASAWVSCAPLACVRWATADHIDGGSAWPADPCGGDGGPLAWVCPPFSGIVPSPDAGCTNAGDMNVIGAGDSGIPSNAVWCCPGVPGAITDGGSPEATPTEGGSDEGGADGGGD
ncbi:MAG TPA: hypothetical protein VF765_14930 [Polyangiaceae bacterium]